MGCRQYTSSSHATTLESKKSVPSLRVARDHDGFAWLAHSRLAYAHVIVPQWGSRCQQHH
jgi:hypothetical protein